MKIFNEAELILNPDGSIYHLNLLPEDIADTILLVGDPDRVQQVSRHFDSVELKKSKREFVTHTGYVGKKRVSVISTGIGTDNIDIVINECDALKNIDFKHRAPKAALQQLQFIRMGTSGALSEAIPVDTLLISEYGVSLDNLLSFYHRELTEDELILQTACRDVFNVNHAYAAKASGELLNQFAALGSTGITLTCSGFYGPQYRQMRVPLQANIFAMAAKVTYQDLRITNAEMETAGIYGLSSVFGHQACSINAIIGNRVLGTFSRNAPRLVNSMIERTLGLLASENTQPHPLPLNEILS